MVVAKPSAPRARPIYGSRSSPVISATARTCPTFSAIRAMTPGITNNTKVRETLGGCTAGTPSASVPLGSPNHGASANPVKSTRLATSTAPSSVSVAIPPIDLSKIQDRRKPKISPRKTEMRPQKPGKRTAPITMNTATANPTHWSCGQYSPATTGARLNPISITTPPVTAGGRAALRGLTPTKWTITPTTNNTKPAIMIAPVTSAESPPWARMAPTPATKAAEVPKYEGTAFLTINKNKIVEIPENRIAKLGSKPITTGKTKVAPNMATTC